MAYNRAQRRIMGMKHDVYKAYDAAGRFLYVGVSVNVFTRLKDHEKYAAWVPDADKLTVAQYPNRNAALAEEARTIREDAPAFNVTKENAWGCELSDEILDEFVLLRREGKWWMQ